VQPSGGTGLICAMVIIAGTTARTIAATAGLAKVYLAFPTLLSGHTPVITSATAIPIETSANRWKATSQPDSTRETSSTIANVTPPNR
jgi:hypothetical protein